VQAKIIINADDLGFSQGITDGIIHAHRNGILTSATLMTTMPDRDRAIEIAKNTPALGVGIHLCLTQGTACSGTLPYLCDHSVTFPRNISKLLLRLLTRPKSLDEVQREWAAQIQYAMDRGIKPTHLDSHQHLYNVPALGRIAIKLANEYGIRHMRCADEARIPHMPRLNIRYRAVSRLARRLKPRIKAAGMQTTDWFFGLACTGGMSSITWLRLLDALPDGTGEVMVHPGYPQALRESETYLIQHRQKELEALCDPAVKKKIQSKSVQLTHYGKY
jgi:chitin disaccharide deacetylase